MEDLDEFKGKTSGPPRYKLARANVFVSPGGFHYIDYLDPVESVAPEIHGSDLTPGAVSYIENSLQSNPGRAEHQIEAVRRHRPIRGQRVLDIGCGGGIFLAKMRAEGADVVGVELNDTRAYYVQKTYEIEVHKRPIEDPFWNTRSETFDVVTLWDVIEHVNYPLATLRAAVRMLKPCGLLLIDTPCRDAFYHRFGELTYRASRGRFPTFLNAMYSSTPFGHKQIFSLAELKRSMEAAGLDQLELERFHELSFPYRFYLKKLVRSDLLATASLPFVHLFLGVFPIRNKILAVGRKKP